MKNNIRNIVIVGGGGYAKVVISIIKKLETYNLAGYTDLINRGEILGVPYLGNDDEFISKNKSSNVNEVVLGIGQLQNSNTKRKIISKLKANGFKFPVIISPSAIVRDGVKIGEGTIIRDGVIISSSTSIGDFSIIGTSVNISYESIVGNYTNISLGSNIGINVSIGSNVLIGMGSTVMNNKKISDNCLIGAGSLVIKDCLDEGVYFGSPAKKIKDL